MSSSREDVFTEEDVPISLPPKWRPYISDDTWKEFRETFIGTQVPEQRVSDARLKESGHASWKSAVLDGYAGCWY